jgi:3-hydroxyisobutyrate dehydrogenase-like beta-hydroxyacid dehydrogenase
VITGMRTSVAVLGLGIIGSRAFDLLVKAGWSAAAWNRTRKGLDGECSTPEEAISGARFISLYLKDTHATREVLTRIAPCLNPGQILMNHSTVDLATTHWLHEVCKQRGCGFLDAPFTGSRTAAGNGQLVYYIGGDPQWASAVEPCLSVTGKALLPCGEVGSATVIKLATNLISACTVQALAEALAIATRHGVDADRVAEAVGRNASHSVLAAMKFPKMLGGDYDTHFSLSNMGKDTDYMLALASSAGLDVPAIAAVSQRMRHLCEMGLGELDFSVLAKPYLDPT